MNTRELALEVLLDVEKNKSLGSNLIKDVLAKYDYEDQREKAFFKRLTEGVLERQITLDHVLDRFSKTPVKKMKPLIRCLLRMGTYQILYMESVPDSAACNEAVKLAKKRGFSSLSGFVNGILRAIAKNKADLAWPEEENASAEHLSVNYSVPLWLVEKWLADYGTERTVSMLQGTLQPRPVVLRFKTGTGEDKMTAAVRAIEEAGVRIYPQGLLPYAYIAEGIEGVAGLPGFEEGAFWVQDVSSMLAVEAAGIKPGMRVLDLCAAPGGKTMSAADQLKGQGELIACDVSEAKAERIRENTARVGFDWVDCCVRDARQFEKSLEGWADVVLADVPCSGLGVIGRKKEIRYRTQPEDLVSLQTLQKEILDTAWRYVKPGGILLYSTCTVNPAENEEMAAYLLEKYPLEAESLDAFLPKELWNEQTKRGYRQLFMGECGTDGFFMARLKKKE